jgi:hypothetical protein
VYWKTTGEIGFLGIKKIIRPYSLVVRTWDSEIMETPGTPVRIRVGPVFIEVFGDAVL